MFFAFCRILFNAFGVVFCAREVAGVGGFLQEVDVTSFAFCFCLNIKTHNMN